MSMITMREYAKKYNMKLANVYPLTVGKNPKLKKKRVKIPVPRLVTAIKVGDEYITRAEYAERNGLKIRNVFNLKFETKRMRLPILRYILVVEDKKV